MLLALAVVSCAYRPPRDWGAYDALREPIPVAPMQVRGVAVEPSDYETLLTLGEGWFRHGAFGNERSISDVMGAFGAIAEVPCSSGEAGCVESKSVLPFLFDGIDRLDGVLGNLFEGNGGPDGTGYTSDLVLTFPPGTTLYGTIAVPQQLHTGLDVEAGSPFPIGLDGVPVPAEDQDLEFLPDLGALGYPGAPAGRVRFRLACAACHYSLDIDADGRADLRSARRDQPTPGSPYRPDAAWGVGNQDISFGWLFSLARNPLLGAPVLAGAVGAGPDPDAAFAFLEGLLDTYRTAPDEALREVVAAMLAQPRGFADVTSDGIYNTMQIPALYTRHAWPANSDGGQSAASDRNNTVWTGALDFTGLIGLCSDRGSKIRLPWEPRSIFGRLDCETFADLMTRRSPAALWNPDLQRQYVDDILGTSDGVPGMLDPESVVVMSTLTLPKAIAESPVNTSRLRRPDDYGGDGPLRGRGMAALGVRIAVEEEQRPVLAPLAAKYALDLDDLMSESVSVALDWMDPPPNVSTLLANAADRVERGREVFVAAGCDTCHRGPYATDNLIHPLSADPRVQFGGPRAPSTAGWRVIDRGVRAYIETEPQRTSNTRPLRRLISAPYDPRTGVAYRRGGVLRGLLSVQSVGYKTTPLRFLWASAPYLHDGGVAVGLRPGSAAAGDDLAALLGRAGGADLIYGPGELLTRAEPDPTAGPRADAALSLQALVLESERQRVIAANEAPNYTLWAGSQAGSRVSMASLGVHGVGHSFWVEDQPGGTDVTALVAYLLALDDCPRDLPGRPSQGDCRGAPYDTLE